MKVNGDGGATGLEETAKWERVLVTRVSNPQEFDTSSQKWFPLTIYIGYHLPSVKRIRVIQRIV